MSKVVHLRLTGRAERFVENIVRKTGLSERDVMAKALWLLERAATTGEVAEKKTRLGDKGQGWLRVKRLPSWTQKRRTLKFEL